MGIAIGQTEVILGIIGTLVLAECCRRAVGLQISGQSSRRGHFLSDLLEPVRHCWQKQLPERQRFRFSPWQVLILWRCSSAWVLPVCVICSRKRRRWHRVLFLLMRSMQSVKAVTAGMAVAMMSVNRP